MSPELHHMIKPVVARFGTTPEAIMETNGKGNVFKNKDVARPRNVAMYVVRKNTHMSLPQIAREFGVRHHTTVLLGCRRVESTPKLLSVAKEFIVMSDDKSFDEAQASYEESMQSGESPSIYNAALEEKEQWEADQYEDENR